MNEELKSILGNELVIDDQKKVPVAHLKYRGKSKEYVTWTILPENPVFFADDEIEYSMTEVDIDIFSKGNYLKIMNYIKKIMKNNEWSWTEDSEEMFEEDTSLYHRTCTFKKERKV